MQFFFEIVRLGLANLRLQLLRSILTALGIIFGVAAVITMVAIGEGSTAEALAQIERLGARNIIVRSQKPPESQNSQGGQQRGWVQVYGLTRADLEAIRETFPEATAIVPLKEVGAQLLRAEKRQVSQAYGTTAEFIDVAGLRVARGRYLSPDDTANQELVCVLGAEVAKEFFPLEDPLGETLRIDDKVFRIVGVLAPVGLSGGAGAALVGRDLNLDVHIPISTARATFGDTVVRRASGSFSANQVEVQEIYLQSPDRERVLVDAQLLRRRIEMTHPQLADVGLIVPYELLENARRRALTGTLISAAIAGISLLVGGIGIMNIMLANVTERTREIGIRRALGATRTHIIAQFLVETIVLSAIGGLIGVALGIGLAVVLDLGVPLLPRLPVVGQHVPEDVTLPTQVNLQSVVLSFFVAAATGLFFGLYPARKAAKQDPIVALRHD